MTMYSVRPVPSEHAPHQSAYIDLVPSGDIVDLLRESGEAVNVALGSVGEAGVQYRYADGKWSIGEMLAHLIDAERILAYRALRIARGDVTPLPGYDGNAYVALSAAGGRSLGDLRAEWMTARDSAVRLYASLPRDAWARMGTVDGKTMSVRAIAYVTAGHTLHHLHGLHRDYGVRRARGAESP
jgi:hypothetical protein